MMTEIVKEFCKPLIYVFWFGALLLVGGTIAMHYIDAKVTQVTATVDDKVAEVTQTVDATLERAANLPTEVLGNVASEFEEAVDFIDEGLNRVAEDFDPVYEIEQASKDIHRTLDDWSWTIVDLITGE